jgi:uncharacterized protein YdhG (YjbR/CyaY superfamily)
MTVDIYIQSIQSEEIKERLQKLRQLIVKTVPEAIETVAYGLPAYKYKKKPLVYFGAFAHHIGIYATPSANENFQNELKGYKQGRGSIQFPNDKELPLDLIKEIILFKKGETDAKFIISKK